MFMGPPFRVAALAAGLALACGCASPRTDRPARGERSVETVPAPEPAAAAEAHAHYGAAIIHEMNGNAQEAWEEYALAARKDPDNEWLMLEISGRLLQSKQPGKALEIVKAASERPSATAGVLARLGLIYLQQGKPELAVEASRAALKRSPDAFAAYQTIFLAHVQAGQHEEAFKALIDAAGRQKTTPEFLVGVSEMFMNLSVHAPALRTNALDRAREVLTRASAGQPLPPPLRLKIADGLNLLGESKRAAEIYLGVLSDAPQLQAVREHVHAKLAEIYLRGSDRERAAEQLQALVRENPANPQVHYALGSLAADEKKYTEAIDHFNKSILLNPDFEPAHLELASSQLAAEQVSDALATLDRARGRFPASFALEMLTAIAYSQQHAYPQAIRYFTAAEVLARASDPKRLNHVFYLQAGAAYERNGDYATAEQYFRKCLELAPDFSEAQNYLGYMWAERGTNLEEAHELLKKAVQTEPKNSAFLDSLAWVLFKLKRPAEALEVMLKAVDLLEEPDATVYDHLGDIQAALNQPDKAREAWEKALKLEPTDEVRKKLGIAPGS